MMWVSSVDNLGMLWVGIELTTLISALLVSFYGTQHALERLEIPYYGSRWDWFCSIGYCISLYVRAQYHESRASALQWSSLMVVADQLNPQWS